MTSSLVGSEMCIRDSFFNCGRKWRLCASVARHWLAGPQQSGTTAPVSYTHLTLPTICSV
eukprot:5005365-Prorocentrum_lima.AAC.1